MYFYFFGASFILTLILTPLIKRLALKLDIVDLPKLKRKIHKKSTPLLGGLAIFITIFLIVFLFFKTDFWPQGEISLKNIIGLFMGGVILMIGGFFDDKYDLKPSQQIIWPILAAIFVIISGVGIEFINNPFGEGYIFFNNTKIELLRIKGIPYYFTPLADMITFLWLIVLMYATKLLD